MRLPLMARIQQSGFKSTGDTSERRAPPGRRRPAQAQASSDHKMSSPLSSPGSSPVANRPEDEEDEESEEEPAEVLPQEARMLQIYLML